MKAKIVLLGEYDSSSFFKLYILPSTSSSSTNNNNNNNNNAMMMTTMDYLCIEDLYYLFFCQHKHQHIYSLFQHIYQLYPHHFYHDSKLKKGYIAKHHVESLAKQLQLFALAELCSLSHDELLNNVADPLFAITNALLLRPVTPKCMEVDLDWSLLPHHLIFSYFSSPPPSSTSAVATNNNNISDSSLQSKHTNHHTTTKNDHSWSYHFLPISSHLMKRTLKAQKQQHAIIECRQRQLVFRQSNGNQHLHQPSSSSSSSLLLTSCSSKINNNSNNNNNNNNNNKSIIEKKRKRSSPSSSLCSSPPPTSLSCSSSISSSSSFSSSSNTIIINPSSSNTLIHHDPPPPSLPPLINHHSPIKKQKLSSSPSSSFSSSSFNNNLDLLATQATKMKGLPLSPEISPQPPVLSLPPISSNVSFHSSPLIQSISLPSLRNVLSDI